MEPIDVRVRADDDFVPAQVIQVKRGKFLRKLFFVSTPQPNTLIRSVMISLLKNTVIIDLQTV